MEYINEIQSTKMISKTGKKTNFLFLRDKIQKENYRDLINNEDNYPDLKKTIIHYLERKNKNKIKVQKNESFIFRYVSREKLSKMNKSNSPKNNGDIYNINYDYIFEKPKFLAKLSPLKKEEQKQNIKNNDQKFIFEEKNIKNKIKNTLNFKKSPIIERFENSHKQINDLEYNQIVKPKIKIYKFSNYTNRKNVFSPKISTPNEYDCSSIVKEKILYKNSQNIKFIYPKYSEEAKNIKLIQDNKVIDDKILLKAFCLTHNINKKSPKFLKMTGRENLSPMQNRILKNNEKEKLQNEDKQINDIKYNKYEKFNINQLIKELRREDKLKKKKLEVTISNISI